MTRIQNEHCGRMRLTQLIDLIFNHQDHVIASLGMRYNISASHAKALFSSRPQKLTPVTNNIVEKAIIKYAAVNRNQRADILYSSTGFGLLLFCCACNNTDPVHEVEFDRIPTLNRFDDTIVLNVYEKKSSPESEWLDGAEPEHPPWRGERHPDQQ